MSTGLIFTETKNRKGKRDGAEFKTMANGLGHYWRTNSNLTGIRVTRLYDETKKQKQNTVLGELATVSHLSRLAFFCHGWPSGISLGFKSKDVPKLARAIAAACESNVVYIGLYACLTGRGAFWGGSKRKINMANRTERIVTPREGFAMYLCSELAKLNIHAVITAHLTSGHTTRNPYKVRISQHNRRICRSRMVESKPLIPWREWVKELNTDQNFAYDQMVNKTHGK